MKKVIGGIVLFLGIFFFSSVALADVTLTMGGTGSTIKAVKAFNEAVASNEGVVDNTAQTEFSSVGIFGEYQEYQAKMYAKEDKGNISIRVVISPKDPDPINSFFGVDKKPMMNIGIKLENSLKNAGYIP